MNLSDLGRVVGDWQLNLAGYDAVNTRLVDRTGNGFHFLKGAGTVTEATHSSIVGLKMHGDCWFEAKSFLPPAWTFLFVCHAQFDAAEGLRILQAEPRSYSSNGGARYAANDPAWETPDTWGHFLGNSNVAILSLGATPSVSIGSSLAAGGSVAATYTNNAVHVVQAAFNPMDNIMKIRVNKGAIASMSMAGTYGINSTGLPTEDVRLGYLPTGPITATGGKHFTGFRAALLRGDAFKGSMTDFDAIVDALQVDPQSVGL